MKKIVVVGTGYVGLSNAVLLAQHNHVTAVDIIREKVEKINRRESPIADAELEEYLENKKLDLTAVVDAEKAYQDADFIIVSTPTNYDPKPVSYTHLDVYKRQRLQCYADEWKIHSI